MKKIETGTKNSPPPKVDFVMAFNDGVVDAPPAMVRAAHDGSYWIGDVVDMDVFKDNPSLEAMINPTRIGLADALNWFVSCDETAFGWTGSPNALVRDAVMALTKNGA